jgi:ankyrin repeat protein
MIENGVQLGYKNGYLETPIFHAILKGQTESVRFLIDYGADLNAVNK